jgi:hypothetical protein
LRAFCGGGILATAALALAGCGDGGASAGTPQLAWDGKPRLVKSETGARVLIGKVKNQSLGSEKFKIKARALKLVDQQGRPIKASVVFASSYVRSLYPQNGRPGGVRSEFPEAEQQRIGDLAVLRSGETTPLTVSWNEPSASHRPARVVYRGGSLPVPRER